MPQRSDHLARASVLAAMLATAAVLALLHDERLINPDTIQLLNAARHWLAGDGFASSIIFYEAQMQFASVPAPLTVWPPGFSWLLMVPLKLGVSPEASAFLLCTAAHLATSWLVFTLARRVASAWIGAVAAIAWLLHAIALMMVLSLYAEPIFMAFTFGSYAALVRAGSDRSGSIPWLFAAGAAAACSILMRYSGVLWVLAAGLWLLLLAVRNRSWEPIRAGFLFGALPVLTAAALFARNLLLSSDFSGGQFDYGQPAEIHAVVNRLLWNSNVLLGRTLRLSSVVFTIVVTTLLVAVVALVRRARPAEPRGAAIGLATSGVIVLAVFLVGNALGSSKVFLDYRYWLPALPFVAILLSVAVHDAIAHARTRRSLREAIWPATIVASALVVTVSSLTALPQRWPIRPVPSQVVTIAQALTERLADGRTLREAIEASSDAGKPMLANLEHYLANQTGRGVVGLTDARFTTRLWTAEEVKHLVMTYGIEQVVFFPAAFEPKHAENANMGFWNDLLAGRVPLWLKAVYSSELVGLYDVIPSELRHTE